MTIRLAVLSFSLAGGGLAQFDSLSCTRDGSTLFFVSRLQQAGTDQPAHGKIFVADNDGVRLFAFRDQIWFEGTGLGGRVGRTSNPYNITGVSIAGNGSALAVSALRECQGFTAIQCGFPDQFDAYDSDGRNFLTGGGHLKSSPNGRWGLAVGQPLAAAVAQYRIFDLEHRQEYRQAQISTFVNDWSQHAIADDGTAVLTTHGNALFIAWPNGGERIDRPPGPRIQTARIDARGTLIVWAEDRILYAARLSDRQPIKLSVDGVNDFAPEVSEDGSRILFLSAAPDGSDPQIYVMGSDGSARRKVTAEADGIQRAVLSGDGKVAFAVTRSGRLLKIDVDSGASVDLAKVMAGQIVPMDAQGINRQLERRD